MSIELTERDRKIQDKLHEDYLRINPSKLINERLGLYASQVKALLIEGFGIPPEFYSSKDVLDVGCGTGERSRVLAELGANLTGVDFNYEAITQAKKLFSDLNLSALFRHGSVYELETIDSIKPEYDIVTSFGVLHHLPRQREAIHVLINRVRRGGLLIIGVGTGIAGLQFLLVKWACRQFPGYNVKDVAMCLFAEWVTRCAHYGHRTEEAVVNDNIINSQHDYLTLNDMIKLMRSRGMRLLGSFPPISRPSGDSMMNNSLSHSQSGFETLIKWNEIQWAMHVEDDIAGLPDKGAIDKLYDQLNKIHVKVNGNVNEYDLSGPRDTPFFQSIQQREYNPLFLASEFLSEVNDFLQKMASSPNLDQVSEAINSYKILFRGTAGLNMNYLSFYKE